MYVYVSVISADIAVMPFTRLYERTRAHDSCGAAAMVEVPCTSALSVPGVRLGFLLS